MNLELIAFRLPLILIIEYIRNIADERFSIFVSNQHFQQQAD